jgi:hypothetical protein
MKTRTWVLAIGGVLIAALLVAGVGLAQHNGSGMGMNGSGYGGMMSGGTPFGGMMGAGPDGMMPGPGGIGAASGQSITLDQARVAVQASLDKLGNPDLVIDEVMEFQDNFYAIVKERGSGHGAFEVLVTKSTGAVVPEYGPNMMWNTKYGMMGWQRDADPMTVSADQAASLATTWLTQNQPGAAAESPDTFSGYYTVHFTKNGVISGMLSVNGYTGAIWYHSWHGDFIQMWRAGA